MAILDKIHLDFQVTSAGNPEILIVKDTSVWGFIEDKPSVIDILMPGYTKVRTYNFVKNKSNVFNSSNLLKSCTGKYEDLLDGVYEITVKGSPDTNCKHRSFLKTDKIRLLIGDLYLEKYFNCGDIKDDKLKILRKIKNELDAAEIKAARGEVKEASMILKDTYKRVREYLNCRE